MKRIPRLLSVALLLAPAALHAAAEPGAESWHAKTLVEALGLTALFGLGGVLLAVLYLQDTCHQAGFDTRRLAIEDLGWDQSRACFTDLDEEKIETLFKLYPWEWMWHEEFGRNLPAEPARFIEPAWKMLLSNKGLLPILCELHPGHPNLLPSFDTPEPLAGDYAQKPKLTREGSNVTLVENGVVAESNDGEYGEEGCIYQALAKLPDFDGRHPVMGSGW